MEFFSFLIALREGFWQFKSLPVQLLERQRAQLFSLFASLPALEARKALPILQTWEEGAECPMLCCILIKVSPNLSLSDLPKVIQDFNTEMGI